MVDWLVWVGSRLVGLCSLVGSATVWCVTSPTCASSQLLNRSTGTAIDCSVGGGGAPGLRLTAAFSLFFPFFGDDGAGATPYCFSNLWGKGGRWGGGRWRIS